MTMKSALDAAVHQIDQSHRTPATKAKMAQRIVTIASEGVPISHWSPMECSMLPSNTDAADANLIRWQIE